MRIAKKTQFGFLIALAITSASFFTSCKNEAKDAARENVTANTGTAVTATDVAKQTGLDPNAPATPPVEEFKGPKTSIKFEKEEYNFGKVEEGEKVEHIYKFTNTGKEPLTIIDAKASCGCTVPEFSKEPVAPGKTGIIKAIFDSKGKPGMQTKQITVKANTEPMITTLKLTGEVKADPKAAQNNQGTPQSPAPIKVQPSGK